MGVGTRRGKGRRSVKGARRKASSAQAWRTKLSSLRLTRLRFHDGEYEWAERPQVSSSDSPRLFVAEQSEEGIQYLALDYVAVGYRDRLVLIPYAALRRVWGEPQEQKHPVYLRKLSEQVAQWVDPSVDPDAPGEWIWHRFISRSGREYAGAVLDVSPTQGVKLRLKGGRKVRLPWSRIGAAVEILE